MTYLIFLVAIIALIYGATLLIKASERIALHLNISHFVIGATLVAFGTSLPEMAASLFASASGHTDLAVSNVVGSVTLNIVLVLSMVFAFTTLHPKRDLFSQDALWILFHLILFWLIVYDAVITPFEGAMLLAVMVAYILFLFSSSKEALEEELDEALELASFNWLFSLASLAGGLILTVVGAHYVVDSAVVIAQSLGVAQWLVGLLLLALGTSLPELVVSLMAIKKGNADLSIGNIIGSNVANFSMVLGSAALLSPLSLSLQEIMFDLLIMSAASLSLFLIIANKLYNRSGALILLSLLALQLAHLL